MKKIILFALYCAPLLSLERSFNRDRFYVDGYRDAALKSGFVLGLVISKFLMTATSEDSLTFADGAALGAAATALGDIGYNYPSADNAVVLGRDAFKESGETDNRAELFAQGFTAATIGLPLLKCGERACLGSSNVLTVGEGLSIFAGVSTLAYSSGLFHR